MKKLTGILLLLLTVMPVFATERLVIYTVNYPLQYFAERIGGEHVSVHFPAPADVDPAFWEPGVKNIIDYQSADLILLNGAGYAKWLNKVSLPRLRLVDTSTGFREDLIKIAGKITHSHGPGDKHSHAGIAFTTWLDFQQAVEQADVIKQAIIKKRPQYKELFEKNFDSLKADLLALHAEMKNIITGNQHQAMLASHPVYQYLARRYAMKLHSMTWEPDVFPDALQWQEIDSLIQQTSATWMIWEGQAIAETVAALKNKGINSIVFEPCANVPAEGDFLTMMQNNLSELKLAF